MTANGTTVKIVLCITPQDYKSHYKYNIETGKGIQPNIISNKMELYILNDNKEEFIASVKFEPAITRTVASPVASKLIVVGYSKVLLIYQALSMQVVYHISQYRTILFYYFLIIIILL